MFVINDKLKIFSLTGLIFSIVYVFIIFKNKVPFAHDTFQYLQLQYIYFNEIVQNHSLPLWIPFVSQGSTCNFYFTPQLNLLSPVYFLIGLVLKNVNYYYLFCFLIWFEEIFFLLGVILLSSLYFKNKKTIFFVSITLLGTDIWYPQIWWNFHLYYFIPIILYCIHKGIITNHFRYLIFSILFFMLSVFGCFIYCFVFSSFVIFIYVLFLAFTDFRSFKSFFLKNIKFKNVLILLIILSTIGMSFYYIKYGIDEIGYLGPARDSSGKISLNTFLTHGPYIGLSKYKEIFMRYPEHASINGILSIDINLYAGFLLVPFIIISMIYTRTKLPFAVGGISLALFLFSIGIIVSHLFYYLYPLGKMFRHIGLTATVFKLFIVFYAGFGFEKFLTRIYTDRKLSFLILIYLTAVGSLYFVKPVLIDKEYFWFVSQSERIFLFVSIYTTLIISIILFGLLCTTKIKKAYLVNILLVVMVIDFFSYKYSLIVTRMPSVSQSVIALFDPYKYDYPKERLNVEYFNPHDNGRMKAFNSTSFKAATYNTIDAFMFIDFVESQHRTDFMVKSVRDYLDVQKKFPNKTDEVYKKYSGEGYPKLMAFSRLNVVKDELVMGKIFSHENFTGNMLFATDKDIKNIGQNIPLDLIKEQNYTDFNDLNERIAIDIQVEGFSFNSLKLKATVNGFSDKHFFLFYSDAYHSHWKAYVNGKETPVIKANIGYKSILIPYGTSEIIFKFGNTFYCISNLCTILILLAILCSAIYIFAMELVLKQSRSEKRQEI